MKQGGIGFFGFLFIALLVVKLTHPDAISWLWVFFPVTLVVAIVALVVVVVSIAHVVDLASRRRKRKKREAMLANRDTYWC